MAGSVITYDGWPQGRFLQVLWEGVCESRRAQCCNDLPVVGEWRQSWGPLDGDQSQVWDCWCQRHCWLKLMPLISCWFSAASVLTGDFPQCLRHFNYSLDSNHRKNSKCTVSPCWNVINDNSLFVFKIKANSTLIQILLVHESQFGVDTAGITIWSFCQTNLIYKAVTCVIQCPSHLHYLFSCSDLL